VRQTINSKKFAALSAIVVLVMGSLTLLMWLAPLNAQGSMAYTVEERLAKNKQYRAEADVLMAQMFE